MRKHNSPKYDQINDKSIQETAQQNEKKWYIRMFEPKEMQEDKTNRQILQMAFVFAGLFPGVPYGFSLLEERNSGYVRYILQRMRPGRYILQRIFFVGLSGVVSTVLPYILLLITIVGITDSATVDNMQSSVVNNLIWANFSTVWGGGLVMLMKGVLLGLFGILWSELTLLISLHVRNRYVAFVLPFVFFQLCWILIPVNNVNPVFLIRADLERSCPVSLPYVILISYILVVIAAICMSFRRKIRNETF